MTFEDREKEIFFETIVEVTGGVQSRQLTKQQIVDAVGRRITAKRANDLFFILAENLKYLDDKDNKTFFISDSGMVYYDFLKQESDKAALERESIQANINNNTFTKRIALFSTAITIFVTYLQIRSCNRDEKRDLLQSRKEQADSIQQLRTFENDSITNQRFQQIYLYLQDTAKVKAKIVK